MTALRIALGAENAVVYQPGYHLAFYKDGDPGKRITTFRTQSLTSLNTAKNINDLSGTFTLVLRDHRARTQLHKMDVVRIRTRGHNAALGTILVGVIDDVQRSGGADVDSADTTITVTGRCAGKYLQITSLFRPVWDPTNNLPTALTFGLGDPTKKTGSTARAIFGYLLRSYTYGRRGMVGESGVPNSRFWLSYKQRFEKLDYRIPFLQFDENDMGTVLKQFEILGFTEAWVDEVGHIVYRQPQWDQPALYTLPTSQLKRWQLSDSDVGVKTYAEVIPAGNPGIGTAQAQALLAGRAPVPSDYLRSAKAANAGSFTADPEFVIDTDSKGKVTTAGAKNHWYRQQLKLGVRPLQITSPLLATQAQAQAQAEGLLKFYNRGQKTAIITIPGDPRVKIGENLLLYGPLDGGTLRRTYYIEGVSHDYQEGSVYDTTLTLTHGRDPGEPRWGNIVLPNVSLDELVAAGGVSNGGTGSDPGPAAGSTGSVTIAPGADRSGASTQACVIAFLKEAAALTSVPLVVTTGTNHNQYVAGTQRQSDHWLGYAADLAVGGDAHQAGAARSKGINIATAALRVVGVPQAQARRTASTNEALNFSSNYTWTHGGRSYRVQIGWLTTVGGDHYNHVHIGVAPA